MEHTKLPWKLLDEKKIRINGDLHYMNEICVNYTDDPDYTGEIAAISICSIEHPQHERKKQRDRAELIVKCVNHHAQLVDALEGMVDTFKQFRDHSNRCGDALNDAEELLNNLK